MRQFFLATLSLTMFMNFANAFVCKQIQGPKQNKDIDFTAAKYPDDLESLLTNAERTGEQDLLLTQTKSSNRIEDSYKHYRIQSLYDNMDSDQPGKSGKWYGLESGVSYRYEIPGYFTTPIEVYTGYTEVKRYSVSSKDKIYSYHLKNFSGTTVFFEKGNLGILLVVADSKAEVTTVGTEKLNQITNPDWSETDLTEISALSVFACTNKGKFEDVYSSKEMNQFRENVFKEINRNPYMITEQEFDYVTDPQENDVFIDDIGSGDGNGGVLSENAVKAATVTGGVYLGYQGLKKVRIPRGRAAALGTLLGIGITAPALANEAEDKIQYQDIELD